MSKKELTIPEIKKQLDDKNIDYKSNLNRDELLSLLDGDSEEQKQPSSESNKEEALVDDTDNNKEVSKPNRYVVIQDFKDLEDSGTVYLEGDIYPRRANVEVDDERIQKLMSNENKIGKPLIKGQE